MSKIGFPRPLHVIVNARKCCLSRYLAQSYLKAHTLQNNKALIHEGVMDIGHVDKSGEMVSRSLGNGVCVFQQGCDNR